jgi:uncharacterized protein (DUF427 family)
MGTTESITLVRNAIHNPNELRHFMEIVPVTREATATVGGHVVARSGQAVVVKEVGRHIYDPVLYFPRADVDMNALSKTDRTTYCPLKGDTEYFDIVVGDHRTADAAWSYVEMALGDELLDLVAFDASKVAVVS